MLELHAGQSDEKIIVTLSELTTINSPYYLFVFTHVLTKQTVTVIMGDDESQFQYRYNQFSIDTDTLFENKPDGEWHYIAYEQASSSNTDPSLSGAVVEQGKMILYAVSEFAYDMYNQPVTYKAYEN